MTRAPRYLLVALAAVAGARPAAAQEACSLALVQAEASYRGGLVERVPGELEPCLAPRVPRRERIQAYSLLARAHVALDELEAAEEVVERLLTLAPDFEPAPTDPVVFAELVTEARRAASSRQVASVSKTAESLWEAPATVVVVTAEEIERRGYQDLAAVLDDLPGFDVSRGNGFAYVDFYQRGYRADSTNRTLFLVDGVEQNDLLSNVPHISRQYPLSNVERVEVIYGPASTIYGANAFTGVINVVTRTPAALVAPGERFAVRALASGGSFDTEAVDLTLAGRTGSGSLGWSLTARRFRSDEQDLSGFPEWDFAPESFDALDYHDLVRLDESDGSDILIFDLLLLLGPALGFDPATYFDLERAADGTLLSVTLTEEGQRRARELDRRLFDQTAAGRRPGFADPTDDSYVSGTLSLPNLSLGFSWWRREESASPWFVDVAGSGYEPRTPEQQEVHLQYSRPLSERASLVLIGSYRESEIVEPSFGVLSRTFASGVYSPTDLLFELAGLEGLEPQVGWTVLGAREASSQLRAEARLLLAPWDWLDLMVGVEARESSIQSGTRFFDMGEELDPDLATFVGPRKVDHSDVGWFAQSSFRLSERLKVVAGARLDERELEGQDFLTNRPQNERLESVVTPRLAVIYLPGDFVLKAIYAEAFKDPSDEEKFPEFIPLFVENQVSASQVKPERLRNLELSAGWHPTEDLTLEASVYRAEYTDLFREVSTDLCEGLDLTDPDIQLFCPAFVITRQNFGSIEAEGVQALGTWRRGDLTLFGNYTYTRAEDPERDLRVGDLARHRLNLGANLLLGRRLNANLRLGYVGARRTGEGTTVDTNPLREIDAYTVLDSALTWQPPRVGDTKLQLVVENLLDEEYVHPGVQDADGVVYTSRHPQPGRTFSLRLLYGW